MLPRRTAWINSRPGSRWRTIPGPFVNTVYNPATQTLAYKNGMYIASVWHSTQASTYAYRISRDLVTWGPIREIGGSGKYYLDAAFDGVDKIAIATANSPTSSTCSVNIYDVTFPALTLDFEAIATNRPINPQFPVILEYVPAIGHYVLAGTNDNFTPVRRRAAIDRGTYSGGLFNWASTYYNGSPDESLVGGAIIPNNGLYVLQYKNTYDGQDRSIYGVSTSGIVIGPRLYSVSSGVRSSLGPVAKGSVASVVYAEWPNYVDGSTKFYTINLDCSSLITAPSLIGASTDYTLASSPEAREDIALPFVPETGTMYAIFGNSTLTSLVLISSNDNGVSWQKSLTLAEAGNSSKRFAVGPKGFAIALASGNIMVSP